MRKVNFIFHDGELRVDAPTATYRLRWIPEAKAEELLVPPDRWIACWPDFRILKPVADSDPVLDDSSGRYAAYAGFRAEIPPPIASAVERFPSHQWPLLEMVGKQPLALDLALSSPALAFALANNNAFRQTKSIEAAGFQAAAYSQRKQRWILEWLGFPGTKSAEKVMRKITPDDISLPVLRRLRNSLSNTPDVQDLLSHRRVINQDILKIVTHERVLALVMPVLLDEIEDAPLDENSPSIGDLLQDILRMLEEIAPRRKIPPLRSIDRIRQLHEEIEREYGQYLEQQAAQREAARLAAQEKITRDWKAERIRKELDRWPDAGTFARQAAEERERQRIETERMEQYYRYQQSIFPPPPIPETEDIQAITTGRDLMREGIIQRNCVGGYAARVLQGNYYVYRVIAPERATLSIVRRGDGVWVREELGAAGNRRVRLGSTTTAVDAWLREYNHSI